MFKRIKSSTLKRCLVGTLSAYLALHLQGTQAADNASLENTFQGKGNAFLEAMALSQSAANCSENKRKLIRAIGALLSYTPVAGVGQMLTVGTTVKDATTCKNNNGQTVFTWGQIMNAVDDKIYAALQEEKIDKINDYLAEFLDEYDENLFLFQTLSNAENPSTTDLNDGLVKIGILQGILFHIEADFGLLDSDRKMKALPALAQVIALDYFLDVLKGDFLNRLGGEISSSSLYNVTFEANRKDYIKKLLSTHKSIFKAHKDIYLLRTESVSSGGAGFSTEYEITLKDKEGTVLDASDSCFRRASDSSDVCDEYWKQKRQVTLAAKSGFRKRVNSVNVSIPELYFSLFERLSVYKGKRFYIAGASNSDTNVNCLSVRNDLTALRMRPCTFGEQSIDESVDVFNAQSAQDLWRIQPKTGLIINEFTGLCLDHEDKNTPILAPCEYSVENEAIETSSQQWRFHPKGLIVNRSTGKCLDFNVKSPELNKCDYNKTNDENVPRLNAVSDLIVSSDQVFTLKFLDCIALDHCRTSSSLKLGQGETPEENQYRLVLAADMAEEFSDGALLVNAPQGFSDSGFIQLAPNSEVFWANQEIIKGDYQMTVFLKAYDASDDLGTTSSGTTTSGTTTLVEFDTPIENSNSFGYFNDHKIQVRALGNTITEVAQVDVSELDTVGVQPLTFEVTLPEYSDQIEIEFMGHFDNGTRVLIDKVVFTPMFL